MTTLTEKTLGKVELLDSYMRKMYPDDMILSDFVHNILGDFVIPSVKATKEAISIITEVIPTSTTVARQPKFRWSPERRAKQMANNEKRRETRLAITNEKEPKFKWSPERRAKQMATMEAKRLLKEGKKIVLPPVKEPKETVKVFPEKIDMSNLAKPAKYTAPKAKKETKAKKESKNTLKFKSAVLEEATYNPSNKTLRIIEKGGKNKTYHLVPLEVKEGLFTSKQPGTFYNHSIKGKYSLKAAAKKKVVAKKK